MPRTCAFCGKFLTLLLISPLIRGADRPVPPVFGSQTPLNRYAATYIPVYTCDFENGSGDWTVTTGNVALTTSPAEVIGGQTSLKFTGDQASIVFSTSAVPLDPLKIYVVEYDYKVLRQTVPRQAGGVVFLVPGQTSLYVGRGPLDLAGHTSTGLRLPATPGAQLGLFSSQADLVIDNLRVYREDTALLPSEIPFWTSGFPRLLNYNLTSPDESALRSGLPLTQIEQFLARYDVISGTDIDQTLGAGAWALQLRRINPLLKLFPYHNSFVSHNDGTQIQAGVADIEAFFNQGLAPEWFMKKPDGSPLTEPNYPTNYQLNHTRYSPVINGLTLDNYETNYISETVLPSGLWNGIHFDQPEWYVNPLLIPRDTTDAFPPIDLQGTGSAATPQFLYTAWLDAYFNYFSGMTANLGYGQILFGNAGYIAGNRNVLPMLNGWLSEIQSPYQTLPGGNWNTAEPGDWYRLQSNYFAAGAVARAPQALAFEFTGMGLGQSTGTLTSNGLPDRTNSLEGRDYQRMRLGLATALLGNGFYEYDLVDNTSPPLWFDEYGVDKNGVGTDASGKGYLGQPLADAVELDYPSTVLLNVDFENAQVSPLFKPVSAFRITSDPNEVISGNFSMVISRGTSDTSGLSFITDPSLLPLTAGKTYQLRCDYKILDFQPVNFQGLFGVGVTRYADGLTTNRTSSLYYPDIAGIGQTGTLRASVKALDNTYLVEGGLVDNGTVAIDNVRLEEGTGGVWRRDFENGIVLVNPTPESISVSPVQIQGPLQRTGIKRILGSQAPAWNSGAAINPAGITIPSGDGIILLAARIAPGVLAKPTGLKAVANGTNAVLLWDPNKEYVAGYDISYGEDPTRLTREAAANTNPIINLGNLEPGATYYFQVRAIDFAGNFGPYTDVLRFTAPGTARSRPLASLAPGTVSLAPGAIVTLIGSGLAGASTSYSAPLPTSGEGASVLVNGVAAPLSYVSTGLIEFMTPWNIAGDHAIVTVTSNGVPGIDLWLPVQNAIPHLTGEFWPTEVGLRPHPGTTITMRATGLGLVEPPPDSGALAATGRRANVVTAVQAFMGGLPVTVVAAYLDPGDPAGYDVVIAIPPGLAGTTQTVSILAGGVASNSPTIKLAR